MKGSHLLLLALKTHSHVIRPILLTSFLDKREILMLKTRVDRSRAGFLEYAVLLLDTGGPHARIMRPLACAGLLDHFFRIIERPGVVRRQEG